MDSHFQLLSALEANQPIDMAHALPPTQQPKESQPKESQPKESCWMRLLMKLPGEVRNEIYKRIAEDDVLYLRPENDSFSVSPPYCSQMYNADHQILYEYISIADICVPTIQTAIYDFDFTRVAAFLDSLSEDNIKTLEGDSKRRFVIKLEMTDRCSTNPPNLWQWLARFAQGAKGAGISFHYRVSDLYPYRLADESLVRFISSQLLGAECFECPAEDCWIGRKNAGLGVFLRNLMFS
jgi:hypothetical protein